MIKSALHYSDISNKSMKKKKKNYKPIYNKLNNENEYTSAIKI